MMGNYHRSGPGMLGGGAVILIGIKSIAVLACSSLLNRCVGSYPVGCGAGAPEGVCVCMVDWNWKFLRYVLDDLLTLNISAIL